jgi:FkbM family methyltransferase
MTLQRMLSKLSRWRGKHSAQRLRKRFLRIAAALNTDTFVEVGAFDGSVAIEARSILPRARIVSFEANPFNHAHFSTTLRHEEHNVEYRQYAISDSVGETTFSIAGAGEQGLSKKSSILRRLSTSAVAHFADVTVPCTTLDAFFESKRPSRMALWIDVEGATEQVLRGAASIMETVGVLLIEVEEEQFWEGQWLAGDVEAFLRAAGLECVGHDREYKAQENRLFVRKAT